MRRARASGWFDERRPTTAGCLREPSVREEAILAPPPLRAKDLQAGAQRERVVLKISAQTTVIYGSRLHLVGGEWLSGSLVDLWLSVSLFLSFSVSLSLGLSLFLSLCLSVSLTFAMNVSCSPSLSYEKSVPVVYPATYRFSDESKTSAYIM